VAAVSGYMFQNALPSVPSNFGYGGVVASYNLFDFGKRQRAVAEARAQLEMSEVALQMTKAKVAADVKKSYFELVHARQLSDAAQKMGASVARLINAGSNPESTDARSARAEVEVQLIEADLAHRQAFARLNELMGSPAKK
jgi:outer membrane protein TolC